MLAALPSAGRFLDASLQSSTGLVCIIQSNQPNGGEGVQALTRFPPRSTLFSYLGTRLTSSEAAADSYHSLYIISDDLSGSAVDGQATQSYGRYVQDPLVQSHANCIFCAADE